MGNREVLSFAVIGFIALCVTTYGVISYGYVWMLLALLGILSGTHLLTLYMLYKFYRE